MNDRFEKDLLLNITGCGSLRTLRDQSFENIKYSSGIKELCSLLQDAVRSKSPQQSLLAEKYCIVFQRNYCTTNEAERDKLNDQLMKLADAQTSVSLVMEPEKYREFARSSFTETREGRLPYHGCAVFVKTQIDTLNRSGQGTGIEAEKELWRLRKENLRVCRDSFGALQEEALFNAPESNLENISGASKEHAREFAKEADTGADGHSFV